MIFPLFLPFYSGFKSLNLLINIILTKNGIQRKFQPSLILLTKTRKKMLLSVEKYDTKEPKNMKE